MATKTYKLIDLFRGFYVLYIADPARGPYPDEESKLNVLVNLLSAQLSIANSDKMPEDIPVPIQNFFERFLQMLYFDRKAVRYVCEKVIQFQTDKTQVDREDKLLHSHLRKIINQLSREETIEMDIEATQGVIQPLGQMILVRFKAPSNKISEIWMFMKKNMPRAKNLSFTIGDGFSVAVEEEDVDRFYSFLEKFAKENNLAFGSHPNEKLNFGDLKVKDLFIDFPTSGDNSGHGGFLKECYVFEKIDQDETVQCGSNAKRMWDGVKSHFPDGMTVIKIK